MTENHQIKETLNVIRKALEDEDHSNFEKLYDDVLILDKLVNEDGTIDNISKQNISIDDTKKILSDRLDNIFDTHISKWLDENLPKYLEKYFNNKKL